MLIDSHCHLNSKEFSNNIEEIIKRANKNDCSKIIVIADNYKESLNALKIAGKYNLKASVGIHPEFCNEDPYKIIPLLKDKNVVAIGECGIDLHWRKDNLLKQQDTFRKQIEISIKYNLPLVIHSRDSFKETMDVLKPYIGRVKGVFHSFTYSYKELKKIIDAGFYVGITGIVTFKNAESLREAVKKIPLNKILIETDAPYLAPVPKRGKLNEPAYLIHTAKFIADLLNITYEEFSKITYNNTIKLFGEDL